MKKKVYKYRRRNMRRNIRIKSNIELSKENLDYISDIILDTQESLYVSYIDAARAIWYQLENEYSTVYIKVYKHKIIINIEV